MLCQCWLCINLLSWIFPLSSSGIMTVKKEKDTVQINFFCRISSIFSFFSSIHSKMIMGMDFRLKKNSYSSYCLILLQNSVSFSLSLFIREKSYLIIMHLFLKRKTRKANFLLLFFVFSLNALKFDLFTKKEINQQINPMSRNIMSGKAIWIILYVYHTIMPQGMKGINERKGRLHKIIKAYRLK